MAKTGHGNNRPLILVTGCCKYDDDGQPFTSVKHKYVTAITDVAQADPVILPPLSDRLALGKILYQER